MPHPTMLQQEDVVKLTEKCGLSSTGSSPVVTPLCTPEDLKSNILKAQAEAAALKVRNRPHQTECNVLCSDHRFERCKRPMNMFRTVSRQFSIFYLIVFNKSLFLKNYIYNNILGCFFLPIL